MKVIFLIGLLSCSSLVFANKIDDLKTETDIKQFVDEVTGYTSAFPKATDSLLLSKIKYVKIDIDKNGLTDLFINDSKIFTIVDIGNSKFEIKYIGTDDRESRLVSLDTTGLTPIFVVKRQTGYDKRYNATFSGPADTITYMFQGFIEYNSNLRKIDLEEIKFSTTRCFGSCPVYDLTLSRNRNAVLNAKAYMKQRGFLKTKVEEKLFFQILNLINYLKVDSLKDDYAVNATDNPSINVEIKYNGITKRIHDYGLEGTLGLQQLYLLVEQLIERQKWK